MLSIYLVIGASAGLLTGLLGIGGGIILVPALSAIFLIHTSIPPSIVMHMAVGTSLATMIVTLASGGYAHAKQGTVNWMIVKKIAPTLAAGTAVGAIIAHFIPSHFLVIFFSLFLAAIGIQLLLPQSKKIV